MTAFRLNAVLLAVLLTACAAAPTDLPPTLAPPTDRPATPTAEPAPIVSAPETLPDGAAARLGRGTIRVMDLSPDGGLLAVGGSVGIFLYDATDLTLLWYQPTDDTVEVLAFSPDGDRLASSTRDGQIKVREAATGRVQQTLTNDGAAVLRARFSPSGEWLAALSQAALVVWNVADGTTERTLTHRNVIQDMVWHGDTQLTTVGGGLAAWDFTTGEGASVESTDLPFRRATTIALGQGAYAAGLVDGSLVLWGDNPADRRQTEELHQLWVRSIGLSADGQHAATGGQRGEVILWDASTAEPVHIVDDAHPEQAVMAVAFSPDGSRLYTAALDNTLHVWEVATGTQVDTLSAHTNPMARVAWAPQGGLIASGNLAGGISLWDVTTRSEVAMLDAHTDIVVDLAWSPDGSLLASGSEDATAILWDVAAREPLQTLNTGGFSVTDVAFTPAGDQVAAATEGGVVHVWDVASGERLFTLVGHANVIYGVYFSPDGALIRTGSFDGTVMEWDASTGERLATRRYPGITNIDFSADGTQAVFSPWYSYAILYDWGSEPPSAVAELAPARDNGFRMLFSPDGLRLVSGSEDGDVLVWDVPSQEPILTLDGHNNFVRGVTWSPDGLQLASSSWDGTVLIWDAPR